MATTKATLVFSSYFEGMVHFYLKILKILSEMYKVFKRAQH